MTDLVLKEVIASKIFMIRHKKVMLDRDLAELYGVPTKSLNLAVKRNIDRFPEDFMFRLNQKEYQSLRFQIETSKRGGARYLPYAFTQNGVAMLSSILKSKKAAQVNILIMRTFTKLQEMILSHKNLRLGIEALERKYKQHDKHLATVFKVLKKLLTPSEKSKRKIGFHSKTDN